MFFAWKKIAQNLALLLVSMGLPAQSQPDLRFGKHTLGEPVDIFFALARTGDSKELTKDYCKALLENSQVMQKIQQKDDAAKNGGVFTLEKKDFAVLDVDNCKQVMAAISGQQARVGARLASEIGKGFALFSSGRLSALNLSVDASYEDSVTDLEKRFGMTGKKSTIARAGKPSIEKTQWEKDGIVAAVLKYPYTSGASVVIAFVDSPYAPSLLRKDP